MSNAGACWIAVVVLVSMGGAACSRGEKSRELSALDDAYKSGIFTKDEYEAKKAALESQSAALAALDKALGAGLLTKDEYQARKARLDSQKGPLTALERAFRAGVLTKDEYLTKKAALLSPGASAGVSAAVSPGISAAVSPGVSARETGVSAPVQKAPAAASDAPPAPPPAPARYSEPQPVAEGAPRGGSAAPAETAGANQPEPARDSNRPQAASTATAAGGAQAHSYRMKMVKVLDEHGFERPLTSVSMLIPTDWQSQGATTWNIKDNCNTIQTTLHAGGPDGRSYEVFPAFNWVWADDPKPLQQIFAQKTQMGAHACDVMPPMGAADYLRRTISRIRPNAQVAAVEPSPKLMQILQQQARQTEQSAAQYRLQQRVRPDVVRARLKYNLNGRSVEEWLIVATVITGTLGPSYNVATMQQTQAYSYSCIAYMVAERAPQGQLDSSEKFFELINATYRVNPEWQSRVNGNALAIQQIELKGVRDRSAIVSKNAEDIRNIQRQGYENRQKSEDHIFGQFSEATRGVDTYRNPSTGETVELSNQYGHAWVNNRGEYLLSDQEGFDPSVTFKEDWKPLERVKK